MGRNCSCRGGAGQPGAQAGADVLAEAGERRGGILFLMGAVGQAYAQAGADVFADAGERRDGIFIC